MDFLPFRPGLGGHCIGVDPLLTHKAQALGYHPEIILAGRRVNDRMGQKSLSESFDFWQRKYKPVCARLSWAGV